MEIGGGTKWKWEDRFFLGALLAALLVFLYHLGLMPLLDDESTRALVSLEMVLSGDYIVPTLLGDLYQNKPPLFNWFLAGLMRMAPAFNEWWLRVPSMLAILMTAIVSYLFFKKELSPKTGLMVAMAYLTCGRILFYDSMLGYIDPFYTLFLFLDVVVLYQFVKGKTGVHLFVISYFLCLLAYFLKGLPALVFHGGTLLTALFLTKNKILFVSWKHLTGIFFFLVLLGGYYLRYAQEQDLIGLFSTLWQQSSSRTVAEFSWRENISYIMTFPFQFILHFLPWSLLGLVMFHKKAIQHVKENQCLFFCALTFLLNIFVYWVSPETRPRYLFVFLPLYFAICFDIFFKVLILKNRQMVYQVSIVLAFGCGIVVLVPMFVPILSNMDLSIFISLFTAVVIFLMAESMKKKPHLNFPLFVLVLLCVRLVFNHFILPARQEEAPESEYKRVGQQIGEITRGHPIHLLEETFIDHDLAYYISSTNGKILDYERTPSLREDTYYVCSTEVLNRHQLQPEIEFRTYFKNTTLYLARVK